MADGTAAGRKTATARKMAKAPNPFVARGARRQLRAISAAAKGVRAGGTGGRKAVPAARRRVG